MNNIKQLTNFDIKNAPTITKIVLVGGDLGERREVEYKIISQTLLRNDITKFGYCCELKAIQYPIFLTINGIEENFQIGKTGMFELQPETWKNINGSTPEEEYESNVIVTEIKVPWRFDEIDNENYQGYNFKLDFIYSTN